MKAWWVAWELNMCGVTPHMFNSQATHYEKSKQFGSSDKGITVKPQCYPEFVH